MSVIGLNLAVLGNTGTVKLRLMRLGLYWHLLDIVWVGIFTFVFLYRLA